MVSITRLVTLLAALVCAVGAVAAQNATTSSHIATQASTLASFSECASAPTTPQDRRLDTSRLKYAEYNAEFLFLVGYGSLKCPGADCKWKNAADAKNHIKAVAKVIKSLDADIVQLNEVEDCFLLNSLISEIAALGDATYKPYLVKGTDSSTGQNSALITRVDPIVALQRSDTAVALPVANSKCPSASGYPKTKTVSKHFFTTFKVAGFLRPITVIGAHLLAKPSDKSRCHEREGQAAVLAGLAATASAAGNHVILSGDLNDFSTSTPDRNGNKPISNVLGILEGTNYYNVGGSAQKTERFSQWWDKNNDCKFAATEVSTLDHIIVSNSLKAGVTNVAYRSDLYQASCTGYNSDHYPITVTLTPQ